MAPVTLEFFTNLLLTHWRHLRPIAILLSPDAVPREGEGEEGKERGRVQSLAVQEAFNSLLPSAL